MSLAVPHSCANVDKLSARAVALKAIKEKLRLEAASLTVRPALAE